MKNTKAEQLVLLLHERLIGILINILENLDKLFGHIYYDSLTSTLFNDEEFFRQINRHYLPALASAGLPASPDRQVHGF